MTNLQLEIGEASVIINVVVRLITAIIFGAFLIPLFIKEAKVKNGLQILRFELLFTGIIIFLVNSIGIVVILLRFCGFDTSNTTELVTYFNTFALLAYAIAKYIIYTQKYTPENKRLHERFEKMETKCIKDAKKSPSLTTNK